MGFFDKIKQGLEKTRRQMSEAFAALTVDNEEFFEELEEALILADAGADTAVKAVNELQRASSTRSRSTAASRSRNALADILAERLRRRQLRAAARTRSPPSYSWSA